MLNRNVFSEVNLTYKLVGVMISAMLVILLGLQTQHAHAFDGCAEGGGTVEPTIDQYATQMMIEVLNERRAEAGTPPMKLTDELVNTALYHAIDMQEDDYFKRGTFDRDASGAEVKQCGIYTRIAQFYGDGTSASLDHAAEMMISGNFANNMNSVLEVLDIMAEVNEYPKLVEEIGWEFGMGYASHPDTGFQKWVLTVGRRDDVFPTIIDGEKETSTDATVDLYTYGDWEQIRFQNNAGGNAAGAINSEWSSWYVFDNEMEWSLLEGFAGEQTITIELVAADGTTFTTSDSVTFDPPPDSDLAVGAGRNVVTPPDGLTPIGVEPTAPLQVGLSSLSSTDSIGTTSMDMSIAIAFIMGVATVGIVGRRAIDF